MTHCKTSKRVYKKRATKKAINGGGVCDIICPNNKKNEEEEPNEEEKEEEEPNEEEKEEEEEEEEPNEKEEEEEEPNEEEEEEEEEEPTKEPENKGSIFGSGGKKSRKHKSRKGARKTAKKPKSAWTTFVTKLYKKKKLTNPLYMFKDALKDAAKLYKK
jgi:outer membrane biosynthesis protein TonB